MRTKLVDDEKGVLDGDLVAAKSAKDESVKGEIFKMRA